MHKFSPLTIQRAPGSPLAADVWPRAQQGDIFCHSPGSAESNRTGAGARTAGSRSTSADRRNDRPRRSTAGNRQPTPHARSGAAAHAAARVARSPRPPSASTSTTEAAAPKTERKKQPERAEKKKEEVRSQRRERRANQPRRRPPQKRPPLPPAKRELLVSVDVSEQRVAILEDDRVAEVYLERPERRSIAGNIYLGTVDNVLPGMEAAFVEIGLEKNGFLYVDEIVVPELEGKGHGRRIQDLIKRGEQVLVQAVKDPMKSKGARLTTEISLPGRFVVYVPLGEGLGVSRRLDDDERARLKEIVKALKVKEGGVIVRTAAEGASAEDVERDLVFLQKLWKSIQDAGEGVEAAVARLPGVGAAAPRHARPLHRRLRARARSTTTPRTSASSAT